MVVAALFAACSGGNGSSTTVEATTTEADVTLETTTAVFMPTTVNQEVEAVSVPENQVSGKFTPPPGRTLLIIGQDNGTFGEYAATVYPIPGGVTT